MDEYLSMQPIGPRSFFKFRPNRPPALLIVALACGFLIWLGVPALAQTVNWTGTTNDWFTGTNWSTGAVPSPADDVSIDTSIFPPPLISAPGATAQRVFVGGLSWSRKTGQGAKVYSTG